MDFIIRLYQVLQSKLLDTFEEVRTVYRDAGLTDEQIDKNQDYYAWNMKPEHIEQLLEIKERQRKLALVALTIYGQLKDTKFKVPWPVLPSWVRKEAEKRKKIQ